MASRRALGGGRILGSGRSLSPAVAADAKQTPSPDGRKTREPEPQETQRNQDAARDDTLTSLAERASTPTPQPSRLPSSSLAGEEGDSLSQSSTTTTTAPPSASGRLVCPICNENMMTLLQLNRHLDDAHQNLEEVEQDEVKTWFKSQMTKAKKFQPLAVLNQKLKGLDVFEANESAPLPASVSSIGMAGANGTAVVNGTGQRVPEPQQRVVQDPDELVTKHHWQRPNGMGGDWCSEPSCGKRLGPTNGNIHCRKCGRLFCEDHTMYQMKLSRSAQHEPVRGYWCRVCETCYKSREGYNDHEGLTKDWTPEFTAIRRKAIDKSYLDVSRLEKRMTKLTQLLANPPKVEAGEATANGGRSRLGGFSSFFSSAPQTRALEQSVVAWEEDATVPKCPYCQQEFTSYSFRRHHCRLCGRVVCSDPQTDCSTEVGLNVALRRAETDGTETNVNVRMCKNCRHLLFSKADFAKETATAPPDHRAFENLVQFERGIRLLLPRFQKLLLALQDPEHPPSPTQLAEATKVRKRLMDSFTQYETAARRIRDLPTTSPTQQKLQKTVYQQSSNFLHVHMLPLKSLPKVLKHAQPPHAHSKPGHGPPTGHLSAAIRSSASLDASSMTSASSAEITALEREEKALRERLIVLEEQRFLVSEMSATATKERRFDEVKALSLNIQDLMREIDSINSQLAGMDFSGAYERAGVVSPAVPGTPK